MKKWFQSEEKKGEFMIKEFIEMNRWGRFVGKNFAFFSPMIWTWLSLFTAFIAFVAVTLGQIYGAFVLFLLSSLMDEIDGKVARYNYQATYLGGFTDGVVDRFADFLMILSFFFLDFPDWPINLSLLLFTLLFATLLPPFIVAYANHRQAIPDPTEKVIWRFAFRVEYVVLFLAALVLNPTFPAVSMILILASWLLNWATVVQALILTFIKAKNYPQKNEQASKAFHQRLADLKERIRV
jgi:phosphatidylglycerophosphate synthase